MRDVACLAAYLVSVRLLKSGRPCCVSMGLIYKITNFLVNTNVCILLYFACLILFIKVIYFHHAAPYALIPGYLAG